MSYEKHDLWQRISNYHPDQPDAAHPFSRKLAAEQHWIEAFTRRAIEEYKRFIYLCCISPTGASPPPIVDEVWHLHLTYTVDYWNHFCKEVLQRDIHHHPSRGGPHENEKHRSWYRDTLTLYQATFGHEPPLDIWPPPTDPSQPTPEALPSSFFFEAGSRHRFWLLLIPFFFILLQYGSLFPYALPGRQYLVFYGLLCGAALVILHLSLYAKEKKLRKLLDGWLQEPVAHELAYIAGGRKRAFLLFLAELIEGGVLCGGDGTGYRVDRDRLKGSGSLLAPALLLRNQEYVSLDEVEWMAWGQTSRVAECYERPELLYNDWRNNSMLPLLVLLMGIARCFQGWHHDKPVGYLVAMMVVFVIVSLVLTGSYSFNRSCTRMFATSLFPCCVGLPSTTRGILLYGFAAVAFLPDFVHLRTFFRYDPDSSAGGDGGGGDGCGSGCGGGCGGCGG